MLRKKTWEAETKGSGEDSLKEMADEENEVMPRRMGQDGPGHGMRTGVRHDSRHDSRYDTRNSVRDYVRNGLMLRRNEVKHGASPGHGTGPGVGRDAADDDDDDDDEGGPPRCPACYVPTLDGRACAGCAGRDSRIHDWMSRHMGPLAHLDSSMESAATDSCVADSTHGDSSATDFTVADSYAADSTLSPQSLHKRLRRRQQQHTPAASATGSLHDVSDVTIASCMTPLSPKSLHKLIRRRRHLENS